MFQDLKIPINSMTTVIHLVKAMTAEANEGCLDNIGHSRKQLKNTQKGFKPSALLPILTINLYVLVR